MLYHLEVKDLALIEKANVEFGPGLNILTGETGAGKSILIGSINLCLGQKANKDMIRTGAEQGFVELIFGDLTEKQIALLQEMDIEPEDGQVIIRRKIGLTRSEIRINDQAATLNKLRAVTDLLIDIHGQHEHQSLLRDGYHLKILDDFQAKETGALRQEVSESYHTYRSLLDRLSGFHLDEGERQRELDFLKFEIQDIEDAALREGEEEELSAKYKKYQNAKKIYGSLSEVKELLENTDFSMAVSNLQSALQYDETLKNISDSLYDLQSISDDTLRDLDRYLDDNVYDEEDFEQITARLDEIRNVMMKYGGTVEKVEQALEEKKKRLTELENYEEEKAKCEKEVKQQESKLLSLCEKLSQARQRGGKLLSDRIRTEMEEMGFLDVKFELVFSRLSQPTAGGFDEAHFMVSLNPGEPMRPLTEVASGGELSRIMLSIKTVLADTDEIPTLIFDEIDTGISGRTAERVSEKLRKISKSHQVILITHLPQIAAKAGIHFRIEKKVSEGHTHTEITRLSEEDSVQELGRLLAGGALTNAVLANARELKAMAKAIKN